MAGVTQTGNTADMTYSTVIIKRCGIKHHIVLDTIASGILGVLHYSMYSQYSKHYVFPSGCAKVNTYHRCFVFWIA